MNDRAACGGVHAEQTGQTRLQFELRGLMIQHEHHRAFHVSIAFVSELLPMFKFSHFTHLLVSLGNRPSPACSVDDATQRDDCRARIDPVC